MITRTPPHYPVLKVDLNQSCFYLQLIILYQLKKYFFANWSSPCECYEDEYNYGYVSPKEYYNHKNQKEMRVSSTSNCICPQILAL